MTLHDEPTCDVGPRVPRAALDALCASLGHDSKLVTRIEVEPDHISVYMWTPWSRSERETIHYVENTS